MQTLKRRLAKLEKTKGVTLPTLCLMIRYVDPIGGEERLTPEEEGALEAYREAKRAATKPGEHLVMQWSAAFAQELLAGKT